MFFWTYLQFRSAQFSYSQHFSFSQFSSDYLNPKNGTLMASFCRKPHINLDTKSLFMNFYCGMKFGIKFKPIS